MENFITGFPGREYQIRQALAEVLGKEKAQFFFDKVLALLIVFLLRRANTILPVPRILLHGARCQILQIPRSQLHSCSIQLPPLRR